MYSGLNLLRLSVTCCFPLISALSPPSLRVLILQLLVQVADQETTLNELRIKKEPKISTEPNFAAPSTPVRTNFERPGAQTPRTPRGTKIKEEKAGVGIVFAIREVREGVPHSMHCLFYCPRAGCRALQRF